MEGQGAGPRLVIAQTPSRLSVVPVGSSEFRKNSALGLPVLIAGCTDAALAPPMLRCAKCAKWAGPPATRSCLEKA